MSLKAVVAGANGFVGKALVRNLLEHGYEVYAIVHSNNQDLIDSESVHYVNYALLSVSEPEELFGKCDYFFNLVWTGLKGSQMGDYDVQIDNIRTSLEMVSVSAKIGAKYVHAGSLIEHEAFNNAFNDLGDSGATHVYGASKFAAHVFTKYEAQRLGIEYSCGLITNAYGPGEKNLRLVTNIIKRVLNGQKISLSRCLQLYDFLFVDDVASAFRHIAEHGLDRRTYTIGSGNPKQLRQYMECINAIISPDVPFEYGSANVCVDMLPVEVFSTKSLEEDTGFKPTVSFEEGISRTYKYWYEKQNSRLNHRARIELY